LGVVGENDVDDDGDDDVHDACGDEHSGEDHNYELNENTTQHYTHTTLGVIRNDTE